MLDVFDSGTGGMLRTKGKMSVSIFLSETVAVKSIVKLMECLRTSGGRPLSDTAAGRWYPPTGGHPASTVYIHTTCFHRSRLSSPAWAHYIPPTLLHHDHQGPDHTVGQRPATGGHVLAFSRVRNNTSGLISSSTSQLPGPDISSLCYCFAWVLLSCPFLSTTALRKGHAQSGWGGRGACLDSRRPQTALRHSVANIKYDWSRGSGGEFDRKMIWSLQVHCVFHRLCITTNIREGGGEKKGCVYLMMTVTAREDP